MKHFDVAVVGGGIAGTSVGYFLAERASVVVLEAESTLGMHSTGRSAALFTECYGTPIVRRLAIASREFLQRPPEGFVDAPLLSERGIVFCVTEQQEPRVDASLAEQQALVPSVRAVDANEIADLIPVVNGDVIVGGVYEPDAMDLDVHGLHVAYQRGIRSRGGEMRTGFRAERIERRDSGWALSAGEEEVTASVVVNAAGAWSDVVAAAAGVEPVGLVPKRRTVFTFAGPEGHQSWPMVVDFDEQFYFKSEGPSLLASPADQYPMEPHDVRHREEDVALGIERIQDVTTMSIRSVQSAWAGLRSFVSDACPLNGWDDQAEDFYWLAGQGGFGIKTSPAMGRYAASMILTGKPDGESDGAGVMSEALGIGRLREPLAIGE